MKNSITGNIENSIKAIAIIEEEKNKAIERLSMLKKRENKLFKTVVKKDNCIITYYTKKE